MPVIQKIKQQELAKKNCASCADKPQDELAHKRHEKNGHPCDNSVCRIQYPHGHRAFIEYIKQIFPLEEKITKLKVNKTLKQLILMASNLTPAIAVSEILKPFHVTPFVASPLAISAMHFSNRGTNHLLKLGFTSASSIAVIALQKFLNLPRLLIRPIMALAVFFIEKNGKHVHTEDCDHDDEGHSKEAEIKQTLIKKQDWLKLLKLQGQINTIPWLINLACNKLKDLNSNNDSLIKRFCGRIGIFVTQVCGLSLGFVGCGHLIDKLFEKFNLITGEEALAMRAEGAVCACCGAPVCVAETASEVGSLAA